jgi:hypothetical protein
MNKSTLSTFYFIRSLHLRVSRDNFVYIPQRQRQRQPPQPKRKPQPKPKPKRKPQPQQLPIERDPKTYKFLYPWSSYRYT